MEVQIYSHDKNGLVPSGYILADRFNPELFWNMCNWSSRGKEKPEQLYSDIDTCNHGVCFENPENGELWMALSFGWMHGDRNLIETYIKNHADKQVWV